MVATDSAYMEILTSHQREMNPPWKQQGPDVVCKCWFLQCQLTIMRKIVNILISISMTSSRKIESATYKLHAYLQNRMANIFRFNKEKTQGKEKCT